MDRRLAQIVFLSLATVSCGCAGSIPWLGNSPDESPSLDASNLAARIAQPTSDMPVTAAMTVEPVDPSRGQGELVVQVRIADEFYLHAPTSEPGPQALELAWELPPGIRLAGAPSMSAASEQDGHAVFKDQVLWRQPISWDPELDIPGQVRARVDYQACGADMCLAPASLQLSCDIDTSH